MISYRATITQWSEGNREAWRNVACARDIVAIKTDAIFQRESLVDRPLVLEELRVDIEPLEQ